MGRSTIGDDGGSSGASDASSDSSLSSGATPRSVDDDVSRIAEEVDRPRTALIAAISFRSASLSAASLAASLAAAFALALVALADLESPFSFLLEPPAPPACDAGPSFAASLSAGESARPPRESGNAMSASTSDRSTLAVSAHFAAARAIAPTSASVTLNPSGRMLSPCTRRSLVIARAIFFASDL
eukprot:31365-Pelagococcus_subviridis.AAC.25